MKGIENKKHSRYKSNYSNVNTEVALMFYREIKPIGFFFHKELIHIIVEPDKSKCSALVSRLRTQETQLCSSLKASILETGEARVQMKSEESLLENSVLLREVSLFVLFRISTDYRRFTPITMGMLLYSMFTN